MSFKDCGPTSLKGQGFSLVGHYKARLPCGAANQEGKEVGTSMEIPDLTGVKLEDKEYFSGSLIETNKVDFSALKRTSSYNADRYVMCCSSAFSLFFSLILGLDWTSINFLTMFDKFTTHVLLGVPSNFLTCFARCS